MQRSAQAIGLHGLRRGIRECGPEGPTPVLLCWPFLVQGKLHLCSALAGLTAMTQGTLEEDNGALGMPQDVPSTSHPDIGTWGCSGDAPSKSHLPYPGPEFRAPGYRGCWLIRRGRAGCWQPEDAAWPVGVQESLEESAWPDGCGSGSELGTEATSPTIRSTVPSSVQTTTQAPL